MLTSFQHFCLLLIEYVGLRNGHFSTNIFNPVFGDQAQLGRFVPTPQGGAREPRMEKKLTEDPKSPQTPPDPLQWP